MSKVRRNRLLVAIIKAMKFFKRKPSEQDVLNALESLIKKGLVEKVIVDGIEQFRLTEKGLKEAEKS